MNCQKKGFSRLAFAGIVFLCSLCNAYATPPSNPGEHVTPHRTGTVARIDSKGVVVLAHPDGGFSSISPHHVAAVGGLQIGDRVEDLKGSQPKESTSFKKTSLPPLSESERASGLKRGVVTGVRWAGADKLAIISSAEGGHAVALYTDVRAHNLQAGDVVHYTEGSKIGAHPTATIESKY